MHQKTPVATSHHQSGRPPEYAELLLERDDPDDGQKAQVLLNESLQIATELGMPPLLERVLSKRDILKA